MKSNLLLFLSVLPFLGVFFLLFIPNSFTQFLFKIAFFLSNFTFILSLFLWILYDNSSSYFQFIVLFKWFFNINYTLGIDGISLFFIILSTLLCSICILASINVITNYIKEYLICFLLLEGILIQVFCALDVLFFYIFFEFILIPMFLIIGIWGSKKRKIRAAYQFFLYTLVGSLLMLICILFIFIDTGTTDLQKLMYADFTKKQQIIFWLAFFASFAIKIPMVPFHIWLPEAHSEAPTTGSVILAGVLLKLGGYGFIRFSLPLFPEASIFFAPLIYTLSIIATLYASLAALRQSDLKKMIAYSSIAHMSCVTCGLFSFNMQTIEGSILLMLGHGIVASSLFLSIGMIYDRYKTRILKYYSGLTQVMPLHSIFFLLFILSNMAFPSTCNFIGEFLVFIGLFQVSIFVVIFISLGIILSAAYSIWLYTRMNFGNWKIHYLVIFQDLSRREFLVLYPLIISIFWLGCHPNIFLETLHNPISYLLINLIGRI